MAKAPRPAIRHLIVAACATFAWLVLTGPALAGYAIQPSDGSVVTTLRPTFLIGTDDREYSREVEVSNQPRINSLGFTSGWQGSCTPSTPFGEPGKFTCQLLWDLPPGTYYWVYTYTRDDDCQTFLGSTYCFPRNYVSGPFKFTIEAAPHAPTVPSDEEEVETDTAATVADTPYLPSSDVYDGYSSTKHTMLTQVIYKTMKLWTRPKMLAVACWAPGDYESVFASVSGRDPQHGRTYTYGFWWAGQPRWLHLSSEACHYIQLLFDTQAATGRNGYALATALHEALHAYGLRNEAQTDCYAVQLVPYAAFYAGLPWRRATYLGSLAVRMTRRLAPPGYWNSRFCRDGGRWDLLPRVENIK